MSWFSIFGIAAIGIAIVAGSGKQSSRGPVSSNGLLKAQGNRIVNSKGKPVSFAGNSFFWSQWEGEFYNADVVKWLKKDWKSEIVRVAVGISGDGYLGNPDAETAKVSAVIDAAIKENLYVIIDWHDHNAHRNEAKAIDFFRKMATKYGKHPHVMYEIFNEPVGNVSWPNVVKPYSERVIKEIRAIDPDNLILVGSPRWSQDVDVAANDPIQAVNVAYTLHFYAATHKEELRTKAKAALEKGVALMVTEYGTCRADGNGGVDEASTAEWMKFMKENEISHCNWSVADKAEAASIMVPDAGAKGGWTDDKLTQSGKIVREYIRNWKKKS